VRRAAAEPFNDAGDRSDGHGLREPTSMNLATAMLTRTEIGSHVASAKSTNLIAPATYPSHRPLIQTYRQR
jgi:hypothetical protein